MGAVQEEEKSEEELKDEELRRLAYKIVDKEMDKIVPLAPAEMLHAAAGWIYIAKYKIMNNRELYLMAENIIQKIEWIRDRLLYIAKVLDHEAEALKEKRYIRNYDKYVNEIHELIGLDDIKVMLRDVREKIFALLGRGPSFDKKWPLYVWLAIYITFRVEYYLELYKKGINDAAKYAAEKRGKEGMQHFYAVLKLTAQDIIK